MTVRFRVLGVGRYTRDVKRWTPYVSRCVLCGEMRIITDADRMLCSRCRKTAEGKNAEVWR